MTEQELQKQRDHEEDLQRLRGFRPIDDTFMRALFRDNLPLAQYVLRVITGKEDLRLTKEETQKDLVRLVGARGLCLDVHGVDDENKQYDLEVQRADAGARPERASYQGDDPIGELMHDFLCSDPDDMKTKLLADKARYLKSNPEGVKLMCKAMEDLREESIQRGRLEGIDQNRIENIKTVMEKLAYTAKQAMDFLNIPVIEQPKYMEKL